MKSKEKRNSKEFWLKYCNEITERSLHEVYNNPRAMEKIEKMVPNRIRQLMARNWWFEYCKLACLNPMGDIFWYTYMRGFKAVPIYEMNIDLEELFIESFLNRKEEKL